MNADQIIAALGGATKVAELCECSPQAVSQWFGIDPATGKHRVIPKARMLFLKAVRPDVFPAERLEAAPSTPAAPTAQEA